MKIGTPIVENRGKEFKVAEHFGRANFYLMYNSGKGELRSIECKEHEKGTYLPIRMLEEKGIEAKTGDYSTAGEIIGNLSSLRDLKSICR